MQKRRKTIGVLVDHLELRGGGYEFELRSAFAQACARLDFNLLVLVGRALGDPRWAAHNSVYELLDPRIVDGAILVTASLAFGGSTSVLERLCEQRRPLPMCSLGLAIPGVPSIVLDSRSGLSTAVEHLIKSHGRRRIACLTGPPDNPDALSRLEAYRSALTQHGIPVDERLIESTLFEFQTGYDATLRLLDRRVSFDAIVASNDGTGLGALAALKDRGVRVPDEVMVTGFDDILISRLADPPLSTVRQPLRRMAELAVELVAEQLAARSVPSETELRTEFVARESCGCAILEPPSLPARVEARSATDFLRQNQARLARLLESALDSRGDRSSVRGRFLLAALVSDFEAPGSFLRALRRILAQDLEDNEVFAEAERAITLLRRELIGTADHLEEIWHAARQLVSSANTRAQAMQRLQLDGMNQVLLSSSERFSNVLNLSALKESLAKEFALARMTNALVALSGPSGTSDPTPFFCLRDGATLELPKSNYDLYELLNSTILAADERRTVIALPLTSDKEPLGLLLFEDELGSTVGGRLREQISSVLRTAALHRELVLHAAAEERNLQERMATAERMKSLSVLAGGVAHDLNNALGPLVGLSDVVLEGLERLSRGDAVDTAELAQDLKTIKSAGLRAAQTIKDLLTLSRQGQVRKEQLDLNQIVLAASTQGSCTREGQPQPIGVLLADEPLLVSGSESHLLRALANLIQNAAEAGDGNARIDIRTESVILREALAGSELVEPGRYAVVRVSDNGPGISPEALGRIFEPFFSLKKLGDRSGSGLGLSIVHGVVKEHGGFIDVKSKLGAGTTFSLFLPYAVERDMETRRVSSRIPRGGGRILIVDDDPVQLRTARRILERLDYRVKTADSGERALELLAEHAAADDGRDPRESPFELVIMDMILGDGEDGLIVFERILRLFPEQRGLLVSGHAPTERSALALKLGLSWLSKPYTAEALARAAHSALHPSLRPVAVPAQ